jgi:NAD(P)-dependent dehydrogenase (short-subunit alcohol dehydrogenase family)
MRLRKSGVIANMGSIGGWRGFGGAGMYGASKFAIAGLSECLRQEVAPLGIEVVCIEPGYFRTNFLAPGHRTSSVKHIADYDPVMEPLRNMLSAYNGKQPGDPEKGARVIVEILTKTGRVQGKALPGRIPLGSDALKVIGGFCTDTGKTLEEWKDIAGSTDHDDVAKN